MLVTCNILAVYIKSNEQLFFAIRGAICVSDETLILTEFKIWEQNKFNVKSNLTIYY